ncbi:cyclin-H [Phlebotomus papatasi]|uniref:Cyclin-H n=1 Tax=Phlebotomus papatasi TaxID=29031 RepID=A0A1B0DB14_PHLPP|nr:cyclin-H [Phlebotomus papatasi]
MYPQSSQKKYWKFSNEQQLANMRARHNQDYIAKHQEKWEASGKADFFLTVEEERHLLQHYCVNMKEFCKRFEPAMPKSVIGSAFHYFKRFYIYNSPMDYHPKEILATCVYLACKVEEFNVSIGQFIGNIKGDRSKAMDIILANELLLMQQLNYYLTIHNPFRPIEGFLIDIKTRCSLVNPDRLRMGIDEFIEKTYLTDICLLYAPSQIALAAVLHAASKEQENLDHYVTESLFQNSKEKLPVLIEAVRKIRSMVKAIDIPPKDVIRQIEKKLEACRNQETNLDRL